MTPKQIVELSIDATLLANARERGIDLAGILENGLRRLDCEPADVREARSRQ